MPPQIAGVATATPAVPTGGTVETTAGAGTATNGTEAAGTATTGTGTAGTAAGPRRTEPHPDALLGARVSGIARDGDAALLTFAPHDGPALRLVLPTAFRLARGERTLLADEDLTAPRDHGPAGPFEDCATRYDARALALNAVLSAVRPAVREVAALPDGGLRLGWGTSFRLEVPGPPASTVTTWHLTHLS